jgi:hypothetical protein
MTFLRVWWQRRREKQQQMTRLDALKWILEHGESWK